MISIHSTGLSIYFVWTDNVERYLSSDAEMFVKLESYVCDLSVVVVRNNYPFLATANCASTPRNL